MCATVVLLECIDVPPDLVSVGNDVKWLQRLYISQDIYKIAWMFQYAFVGTFRLVIFELFLLHQFMIETWSYAKKSSNVPIVALMGF